MRRPCTAAALLIGVLTLAPQDARPGPAAESVESYDALVGRLDASDWKPPCFAEGVPIFDQAREESLLREMLAEPYTMQRAGFYSYRTSPKRVELGRRLFHLYDWGTAEYWRPNERYIFHAAGASTCEEFESRWGILRNPDGGSIGIVGRPAPDGRTIYGWSCAVCHAGAGTDGKPVPGAPNHRYDHAGMHHRGFVEHVPRPDTPGPGLLDRDTPIVRLGELGPGRIDMNGDRTENAVKIPALWGLRETRSGMFANGGVANIWMGMPHNGGPFPAGELLEALVAYVLSLDPPTNPRVRGEAEARGEAIFREADCGACHAGPYFTNGEVIPVGELGTNAARVRQDFPKGYRVPTLRRLDLQLIFLHDGSVASLSDLFSAERLKSAPGHAYGIDLTEKEKNDLVAYLLSL